ncbi:hypothetical protein SMSP2_00860 [Limihaloglobus sulfuriphilus]|uniref:EF-hand domain-containing protein n=1 Tax=Limihaloglobus sulfuriphilus TaxID=1851148 RepID=A0A1Q2MD88_9BACT|nr:hypothetical protein [Limihaloglobus sulfuriphilus]AQQ70508.1 hypothetical protein SMSP2_00860 [Limihaloglobus sulfuriphilus]
MSFDLLKWRGEPLKSLVRVFFVLVAFFMCGSVFAEVYFEDNFEFEDGYDLTEYDYEYLVRYSDPLWDHFLRQYDREFQVKVHQMGNSPADNQAVQANWFSGFEYVTEDLGVTSSMSDYTVTAEFKDETTGGVYRDFGLLARCYNQDNYIYAHVLTNTDSTQYYARVTITGGTGSTTSNYICNVSDVGTNETWTLALQVDGPNVKFVAKTSGSGILLENEILLTTTTDMILAGPAGLGGGRDVYFNSGHRVWCDNFRVSDGSIEDLPEGLFAFSDLNKDGFVSLADFSLLSSEWGTSSGWGENFRGFYDHPVTDIVLDRAYFNWINGLLVSSDRWTEEAGHMNSGGLFADNELLNGSPAAQAEQWAGGSGAVYTSLQIPQDKVYSVYGSLIDYDNLMSSRDTETSVFVEADVDEATNQLQRAGFEIRLERYADRTMKIAAYDPQGVLLKEIPLPETETVPYEVPFEFSRNGDQVTIVLAKDFDGIEDSVTLTDSLDVNNNKMRLYHAVSGESGDHGLFGWANLEMTGSSRWKAESDSLRTSALRASNTVFGGRAGAYNAVMYSGAGSVYTAVPEFEDYTLSFSLVDYDNPAPTRTCRSSVYVEADVDETGTVVTEGYRIYLEKAYDRNLRVKARDLNGDLLCAAFAGKTSLTPYEIPCTFTRSGDQVNIVLGVGKSYEISASLTEPKVMGESDIRLKHEVLDYGGDHSPLGWANIVLTSDSLGLQYDIIKDNVVDTTDLQSMSQKWLEDILLNQ